MKVLYRSRKNRVIAGVCGGLGEYFDIDPVLIRIAWVILLFAGGFGFLAYLIAWVLIPDEKTKNNLIEEWTKEEEKKTKEEKSDEGPVIIALFLIFIGVMFLFSNLGWFYWSWGYTWPALLIVIGVIIILSRRTKVVKKTKSSRGGKK